MEKRSNTIKLLPFLLGVFFLATCGFRSESPSESRSGQRGEVSSQVTTPKSTIPPLQKEILDEKNTKTESSIGKFDFKNFTYPLPRGWQDIDSKEITLINGVRRMTEEKIGMSYVATKYFDITGDGEDDAFVILKVATGSITIPQIVYIFEWKEDKPELLWYFRTGDRADGGLKKLGVEDGELVVELFGIDRYIFTQMETSKIVGDEQRLCCPTHYTKTRYKQLGNNFVMQGDRWTYSLKDADAAPVKNMNEVRLEEERGPKK